MAFTEVLGRLLSLIGLLVLCGGLLVLSFLRSRERYGSGAEQQEPQVNCPSCGSRLPADSESCRHCGEPLQP